MILPVPSSSTVVEGRRRAQKGKLGMWARKEKTARIVAGMSYVNASGKPVPAKKLCTDDCECSFLCLASIPMEDRQLIFDEYHAPPTREQQRAHLASLIWSDTAVPGTRVCKPKVLRLRATGYYLRSPEGEQICVCRIFFCNTFGVSHKLTSNIIKKKSLTTGHYNPVHGNKGRIAPNITSDICARRVRNFINKVPKLPSHYCRKHSQKLYFEATLNMAILYRLYRESEYADADPVLYQVFVRILKDWEPELGADAYQVSSIHQKQSTSIETQS